MTAQTFSFRADSRGLRQILRLSRSVTQSVWPRFYLKSLWEGEKNALSILCLSPVCRPSLLFFCCSCCIVECFDLWERNRKPAPQLLSESSKSRCCEAKSPPAPQSPGPPPPPSLPHHSLMKRPRDDIWHWSIDVTTRRLKAFCQ